MKIYLAGAMTYQTYEEMNSWRVKLENKLLETAKNCEIKLKVYNPVDYYTIEDDRHQSDAEVMDFDLDLVLNSDLVVINTKDILKSPGTITECALAWKKGIPILGFGEEPDHPWVRRFFRRIDKNMDETVDYVKDFCFM
jgi:nucleoside 2-deoxyribosyltransferase